MPPLLYLIFFYALISVLIIRDIRSRDRDWEWMQECVYSVDPMNMPLPALRARLDFLDWILDSGDGSYWRSMRRALRPYRTPLQRYFRATGKSLFYPQAEAVQAHEKGRSSDG